MVRYKNPVTKEWRKNNGNFTTCRIDKQHRDALKELGDEYKTPLLPVVNAAVAYFLEAATEGQIDIGRLIAKQYQE